MTWLALTWSVKIAARPVLPAGRRLRQLLIVELDADHERRRLDLRRRDGEAAGLRLPGRDGLQHRLDASREDLAREGLERDLDRLADLDVARVDLRDLRAEDRLRGVDEGHHRRLRR